MHSRCHIRTTCKALNKQLLLPVPTLLHCRTYLISLFFSQTGISKWILPIHTHEKRTRYKSLLRWYINTIIEFLDIIQHPVFYLTRNVSGIWFSLHHCDFMLVLHRICFFSTGFYFDTTLILQTVAVQLCMATSATPCVWSFLNVCLNWHCWLVLCLVYISCLVLVVVFRDRNRILPSTGLNWAGFYLKMETESSLQNLNKKTGHWMFKNLITEKRNNVSLLQFSKYCILSSILEIMSWS
jgi:hypothetical protein